MTILFALLPVSLSAAPKADPGSEKLCPRSAYQQTVEGVWFEDDLKTEALLFRLAYNSNGEACYAWLNALPSWKIDKAGEAKGKISSKGGMLTFKGKYAVVTLDPKTGNTTFARPNKKANTFGRVTR
ncbi:hypothetical protein [Salipiger sp.]|uniref:hypothetical protein n=1 Tax=Salipiger sp. TaxID=2078585 RepID=UPI003A97F7BE